MALLAGLRLPRPDGSNAGMWAIAGGHALNHTTLAAFSLLLPFIARDLGLSFSQVGLLVSVRQFMSVVVNIPAGVLVDVVGQRERFMAVSLLGALLPYLVVALAPTLPVMAACMAVVGAAMFLWHPAAITMLSVLYPDRRGYGLALHEVGANAGMTLAPLAAGFLVASLTWRGVLAANVALGLPLALFLLSAIARLRPADGSPGQPGRTTRGYAGNLRAMLRNGSFVVLAATSGIRSMTQSGLSTFLPLYLVYTLGVPAPLLGVYLTILQVSGMVATPLSGTLSDRYGPKRVATAGMFVTSVVVLAAIAVRSATAFVAVLAPLGFFVYSMRPAIFRWALGVVPRDAEGATVGALFTAQALFSTFTPVLGGVLADRYGLEAVFVFIAGTVLVANLATAMVPDLRR